MKCKKVLLIKKLYGMRYINCNFLCEKMVDKILQLAKTENSHISSVPLMELLELVNSFKGGERSWTFTPKCGWLDLKWDGADIDDAENNE